MRIESSNVQMSSASTLKKSYHMTEQLRVWKDQNQGISENSDNNKKLMSLQDFVDQMKERFKYSEEALATKASNTENDITEYDISKPDEDKIKLLNKLLEALTGKKLKFVTPVRLHLKQAQDPGIYKAPVVVDARQGWGVDYQKHEVYSEQEQMSFSSVGKVITSDGREIKFNVNLNLSRSFQSERHISLKAGDALIDPLVINFGQSSAELTTNKFAFDLNNDGKKENISFAKNGSGYLVFDRNNDGKINNGSELFGPSTGNGFMELTAFDTDGNNWIDENDDIYDKLQIWTKDENGNDKLFAIGEKGIGAIYLGSIQSSFALKDSGNNTQGQIQRTGIFLKEDGTAGTIQHVDISI